MLILGLLICLYVLPFVVCIVADILYERKRQ